jgi:hypothetical protein
MADDDCWDEVVIVASMKVFALRRGFGDVSFSVSVCGLMISDRWWSRVVEGVV